MPERSHYADGAPCWTELTTPDLPAAVRFYEKVFGWTCRDLGPEVWNYTVCLMDGKPVAALTAPPVGLEHERTAWKTYLATSDIMATAVRIEANNGTPNMLPVELPGFGMIAMALDPEGACFGLWQAGAVAGARLHREVGAMCWNELHARNADVVDPFYQALFGYEQEQTGDGVDFDYVLWKLGDEVVAGRLQMGYEVPQSIPDWTTYLSVADCAESAATVVREGGELLIEQCEVPHGLVAVVADPGGATFSLCEHVPGGPTPDMVMSRSA